MKSDEKWDVQVPQWNHSPRTPSLSLDGLLLRRFRAVSVENLRLERSSKATWWSKVQANDRDTHARTTTMRAVRGALTVQYTWDPDGEIFVIGVLLTW